MMPSPNGQPSDALDVCSSSDARPPRSWIAETFARLNGPLVAYTRRRLGGDVEGALDVVQEAFVKLCQQSWPDIEPLATAWLYKTCRNRAIDLLRREGRSGMNHSNFDVAALQDRSQQPPDHDTERDEQLEQVRALIDGLSEQQQEVLRLRLQGGLSYKQIAEVTGLTATNVGYHLHQAIARLRGQLM